MRVQHLRGTTSQWKTLGKDIVPLSGELVVEIDEENRQHKLKIGDGEHTYEQLSYIQAGDEIVSQVLPRITNVVLDKDKWEPISIDGYSTDCYRQQLQVEGVTTCSRLDLQPTADMILDFSENGLSFITTNLNGVIVVDSVGNYPTQTYTIQATLVETNTFHGENVIIGTPLIVNASSGSAPVNDNALKLKMPRIEESTVHNPKAIIIKGDRQLMQVGGKFYPADSDYVYFDIDPLSKQDGIANVIAVRDGNGNLYTQTPVDDEDCVSKKYMHDTFQSQVNHLPVTQIVKYAPINQDTKKRERAIRIECYNLNPEHSYKIYLLTKQRGHGTFNKPWRHPSPIEEEHNPKVNMTGYAALYAQAQVNGDTMGLKNIAPPSWMPNGGILQTEWVIPKSESGNTPESFTLYLDVFTWILDLVKPKANTNGVGRNEQSWCLIGTTSTHQDHAPRLFRFVLYDETTQEFGVTFDTLRIGSVNVIPPNAETELKCNIDYLSII